MNEYMKLGAAFGAGVITGIGAGYIWFKKRLEAVESDLDEVRDILDEVTKELEDQYREEVRVNPVEQEPEEVNDVEAEEDLAVPEGPYVIFAEDFAEGKPEYEKVDLTYYAGDHTLCDAYDDIVKGEAVGVDNLSFLDDNNTVKEMYIRDDNIQTDYAIVKVNVPYAYRDVLEE